MIGQKFAASIVMEVIDALAELRFVFAVLIHNFHFLLEFSQEFIHYSWLYEAIITSNAKLSAVKERHSGCFLGSIAQITGLVNDHGAFAAELKDARYKILCCSLCNKFTFLSTASKDNEIDRWCSRPYGNIDSAVYALVCIAIKESSEKLL